MDEFFFRTNDISLLESCQLYINATYQPSSCCKIEAANQRCSIKKVFLKILRKTPVPESFLIKLKLKRRPLSQTFSVNIAKFLWTPFFIEQHRWLPLIKLESNLWNWQNFSSSYFWLHLVSLAPSIFRYNSCKTRYPQKVFVVLSFHIAIQTSKYLKNGLEWYIFNRRSFPAFTNRVVLEIVFWMVLVLRTHLYITVIRGK